MNALETFNKMSDFISKNGIESGFRKTMYLAPSRAYYLLKGYLGIALIACEEKQYIINEIMRGIMWTPHSPNDIMPDEFLELFNIVQSESAVDVGYGLSIVQ